MSADRPEADRRRSERTRRYAAACIAGAWLLGGCSSWLPRGESESQTQWKSFDEARATFDRIEPYRTTAPELAAMGLDPFAHPNVAILSYSDVIKRFIPSPQLPIENLAQGVADCLRANEDCRAYEIDIQFTRRKRIGSFVLDILNFVRKTEISGWRFNGLVLLKGDLVVYKLWGGQPQIRGMERSRNPLGPLQGGVSSGLTPVP
jgi:hypothetical protein